MRGETSGAEQITNRTMAEHLKEYGRYRDALVKAAQIVRDKAVSYRNFKVGCAVMSWSRGLGDNYLIRTAGNFKPAPRKEIGREKRCAERNALEAALTDAPEVIVAITTASHELTTEVGATEHDALHPCRDCRDLLRELMGQGVVRDETIVHSVYDSKQTTTVANPLQIKRAFILSEDELTVKELLERYADDEKSD